MALSPHELRGRLGLDYEAVTGMTGASLGRVRAFDGMQNLRAGREVTEAEGRRGLATHYAVEYRFPFLIAPGRTHRAATAVFDLQAMGNYPCSDPIVTLVSRPLPYSHRVNPSTGAVCIGPGWERARGNMLLAHLVVHVARLINFDEPVNAELGYSRAAHEFWRRVLGWRPYLPDLVYPVLPAHVSHGVDDAEALFRAAAVSLDQEAAPVFRALQAPAVPYVVRAGRGDGAIVPAAFRPIVSAEQLFRPLVRG